jgi:hypothetical protein
LGNHAREVLEPIMTTYGHNEATKIAAREVSTNERIDVLPRHFGAAMLTVENAIFAFMRSLCPQYSGGHWAFYELSNGGFYMAPQGPNHWAIHVDGNAYDGEMTADAAGITACLFALSHLSFQVQSDRIGEHYHLLRDFAVDHPEAGAIFAAID